MYDCIIIGAGPAGMTAAIYTARKKLKTLVLAKEAGGQMVWSSDVENYTGFSMISGADLTAKFQDHLNTLKEDLEVKIGVEVVNVEKNITSFTIQDSQGGEYYSKTVIIAAGKVPRHLGIVGEKEFYGHGVSTCATCDAPLYKGKKVAVVGGGNSAMDAVVALAKLASQITLVNINHSLAGDEILKQKVLSLTNVKILNNSKAVEIVGNKSVEKLRYQPYAQDEQEINVDGVFIEIGYEPASGFDSLVDRNQHHEIKVGKNLQTSVDGLFAAGDINDLGSEQIIIAAGEGAQAALSVSEYLNKQK